MGSDSAEMVQEIKEKVILHWNCRGLTRLPEVIRKYGNHICEIYLKWNKLAALPPWIAELISVTNLYLYGNVIKELPKELGDMTQLTVLDLSANKLDQLHPCLGSLFNLKSLLLNDNSIQKLPVELNQLYNLEILSLSGNQLVALPEWVGSLPSLKELNADKNNLRELPNRLTLSPELSMLSVCANRLRYLPLNGFLSTPCIRYDANECMNYLSYPVLFQLVSQLDNFIYRHIRNSLDYKCFKIHSETDTFNTNIKLRISMDTFDDQNNDVVIVLPRQLLIIHDICENHTISLYELALRKVYTERYRHTLDIFPSNRSIKILFERLENKMDLSAYSIKCVSYNLITNGPASICVNSHCNQPIFTEAYVVVGAIYNMPYTTVALCCCKRCACDFLTSSATSAVFVSGRWRHIC